MPLRTTQRNASRITSSSHGCHVMKRMPVVMKLSSVVGSAARISRSSSHGSSRWKRTETPMWVLEVKSSAWKPTCSIVGATERMSWAVSPVALQRLWLPSRVVVSTIWIVRLTNFTRNSGCPCSTSCAFSAQTSTIVPATPAAIELIIFITSIRQTVEPARRVCRRRRTALHPAPRPGRSPEHRRLDRDDAGGTTAGPAGPAPRRWLRDRGDVQRAALRFDPQLVELRLVDQPEDLADVVIVERHQCLRSRRRGAHRRDRSPSPAVAPVRAAARAVTGRAWRT